MYFHGEVYDALLEAFDLAQSLCVLGPKRLQDLSILSRYGTRIGGEISTSVCVCLNTVPPYRAVSSCRRWTCMLWNPAKYPCCEFSSSLSDANHQEPRTTCSLSVCDAETWGIRIPSSMKERNRHRLVVSSPCLVLRETLRWRPAVRCSLQPEIYLAC